MKKFEKRLVLLLALLCLSICACSSSGSEDDGACSGDPVSLPEALETAAAGDVIAVKAGEYTGPLTIPSGVRVCAPQGESVTIKSGSSGMAVKLETSEGLVTALENIRVSSGSNVAVVATGNGEADLRTLAIVVEKGIGVAAEDLARLELQSVSIKGKKADPEEVSYPIDLQDYSSIGLAVSTVGEVVFSELSISKFTGFGVILNDSSGTWTGGSVSDCIGIGVLQQGGDVKLVDVKIERIVNCDTEGCTESNEVYGYVLKQEGELSTEQFVIEETEGVAYFQESSSSEHENYTATNNGGAGIWLQDSAVESEASISNDISVSGSDSRVSGNLGAGVMGIDTGDMEISGMEISGTEAIDTGDMELSNDLASRLKAKSKVGGVPDFVSDGIQLVNPGGKVKLRDISINTGNSSSDSRAGIMLSISKMSDVPDIMSMLKDFILDSIDISGMAGNGLVVQTPDGFISPPPAWNYETSEAQKENDLLLSGKVAFPVMNPFQDTPSVDWSGGLIGPGGLIDDDGSLAEDAQIGSNGDVGEAESCDAGPCCKDGVLLVSGEACDDGDLCTFKDSCRDGGICKGRAILCQDDEGACGKKRVCNGTAECSESLAAADTPCGDDPTECSDQDTCDGAGLCQANDLGVDWPCGDAETECVKQDYCDGQGECADSGFAAMDAVCGDGPSECSGQDRCDSVGSCLANDFPTDTPCGDDGDECVIQDVCDGSGSCQDMGFKAINTACGDGPSDCSAQDSCDGAGACLLNHLVADSPCGDDGTNCWLQDLCDGQGVCQDKGLAPENADCGDGSTECSGQDTCNDSGDCLPRHYGPATICGEIPAAICHEQDYCNSLGECQDNGYSLDGEVCDDLNNCSFDDKCNGQGACLGQLYDCNDHGSCNLSDAVCTCNGAYTGDYCDQCAEGYYLYPDCVEVTPGFVAIDADSFWMGSPGGEDPCPAGYPPGDCTAEMGRFEDEVIHQVELTVNFEMQAHEVTQGELETNFWTPEAPCESGNFCNHPAAYLTWFDALAYANKLSSDYEDYTACYKFSEVSCADESDVGPDYLSCMSDLKGGILIATVAYTGREFGLTPQDCTGYRLPTEAEWEYAIRAGSNTAFYPSEGNDGSITAPDGADSNLNQIAWYSINAPEGLISPVGGKEANAWGLYDMSGNVAEWIWDRYCEYDLADRSDPYGGGCGGPAQVIRGGSITDAALACRSAARSYGEGPPFNLGLRLVRSLPSVLCAAVSCGDNAHCDSHTGDCVCNLGYMGDPDSACVDEFPDGDLDEIEADIPLPDGDMEMLELEELEIPLPDGDMELPELE